MTDSVWVITYVNDMDLVSQYAYTDFDKAKAREKELHKSLYEHWFKQYRDDFSKEATFMDYQYSDCWNNLDSRTIIHLYEASLE